MRTLICEECKNKFQEKGHGGFKQKYCSSHCREKAAHRRHYRRDKKYYHDYNCKYRRRIKEELFKILGNKCANIDCPIPRDKLDVRCLQIDHIDGGGTKIRKISRAYTFYSNILRQIQNGSKNYQLLCVYCNWLKSYKEKERPLREI